jgi:phage recombination protein Bet
MSATSTTTEAVCRCCGSRNITWLEHCGPTGVVAPDGGAEYRSEAGVYCLDCGAIEDEPEDGEFMTQTVTIHEARGTMAAQQPEFTRDQVELIRRTIAKGCSDDELQLFLGICRRSGLDPFSRQAYCIRRWDAREKREVAQVQVSIDGLRSIADRSGKYEGQVGPYWCGRDGKWVDVWVPNEPPVAAKVGVLKAGCREPFWSVAKYAEYLQTDRDGKPVSMWRKMPANQLAKCSEALSLRKGFPQEMSNLYVDEEMGQADNVQPPHTAPTPPAAHTRPASRGQEGPDRPWKTYKGMVEEFGKLKARLGPEEGIYYEVLSEFGVGHCNEFKNLPNATANATAAYFKLLDRIHEVEAAAADSEEYEVLPEPETTA